MKIRFTVQMPAGATRNGEPWPKKGEPADIPTAEALHYVNSGIAEAVEDKPRRAKP